MALTGFTNLAQFTAQLDRFIDDTGIELITIVRRVAFGVLRGVVMKTPVDTGRAQGNWNVAVGTVDDSTDDDRKGAQASLGPGNATIAKYNSLDVINISNNLPYIKRLEEGHSWKKAPNGMVAVTVVEQRQALEFLVSTKGRIT